MPQDSGEISRDLPTLKGRAEPRAASLRNPSQSVRNPTTWFQLGVIRDAGPEITNGLGAFLYLALLAPTWPRLLCRLRGDGRSYRG
jgi:hypothetical protein